MERSKMVFWPRFALFITEFFVDSQFCALVPSHFIGQLLCLFIFSVEDFSISSEGEFRIVNLIFSSLYYSVHLCVTLLFISSPFLNVLYERFRDGFELFAGKKKFVICGGHFVSLVMLNHHDWECLFVCAASHLISFCVGTLIDFMFVHKSTFRHHTKRFHLRFLFKFCCSCACFTCSVCIVMLNDLHATGNLSVLLILSSWP